MRKHFIKFLICLLFSIKLYAADIVDPIKQAEQNFQGANYEAALKNYQQALTEWQQNKANKINEAAFFYNFATIAMKNNKKGLALAYILKAKREAPYDDDIQNNYTLIQAAISPNASLAAAAFFNDSISKYFPFESLALCACILLFAFLFLTIKQVKRPILNYTILLALTVFISLSALFFIQDHLKKAIIIAENPIVRSGPGDKFSEILGLEEGSLVRVLDEDVGWHKVSFFLPQDKQKEIIGWLDSHNLIVL